MDSGAFSEIKMNGGFGFTPEEYFSSVLEWEPNIFVNMDWMCEADQLAKTGKTLREHQELSTENQIILHEFSKDVPSTLMGTLQGWSIEDYLSHIDHLKERGMLLENMGIGSICRRGKTKQIVKVIRAIKRNVPTWVKLHGFGIKIEALNHRIIDDLHSADSMAWSYAGRMQSNPGFNNPCVVGDFPCFCHAVNCANCGAYMKWWVEKVERKIEKQRKQTTFQSLATTVKKDG